MSALHDQALVLHSLCKLWCRRWSFITSAHDLECLALSSVALQATFEDALLSEALAKKHSLTRRR